MGCNRHYRDLLENDACYEVVLGSYLWNVARPLGNPRQALVSRWLLEQRWRRISQLVSKKEGRLAACRAHWRAARSHYRLSLFVVVVMATLTLAAAAFTGLSSGPRTSAMAAGCSTGILIYNSFNK